MISHIKKVEEILLLPNNLTTPQIERVIGQLSGPDIDYTDLYLQHCYEESWYLEDGLVKEGDYSIDAGFGLRVMSGEKVGFAHADSILLPSLEKASQQARAIVSHGQSGQCASLSATAGLNLYPAINPFQGVSAADKVALLQRIDRVAKARDPRIKQVFARLNSTYEVVLIYNNEGQQVADIRPLIYLSISVLAEQAGRKERGRSGGGARASLDFFSEELIDSYITTAVNQALLNLESIAVPAGEMTVVLGSGWPGVLLHEAIGHGLEADFIRKKSSAFTGKVGQSVASPLCTIVDDATIEHRRGSLNVDDEGVIGQNTVLIENGKLKQFMSDKLNARLMGQSSTGNGRRESYACLPLPRMTNTYMLPGESDPEEIIASVKNGIYAVDFAGGQVDITSGQFVFSMSEAYLIENGKKVCPVKGATLVGNGPAILKQVSMVGHDLALDSGIGFCGKDGQTVPVGVGQPTIKLDKITVGGVQAEG